jgi:diguanylate cyclase (GGDEF)-like protein
MKVLIAEDDPISRRLLEATLTKWGYDVVVACDGEEAWQILQEEDAPRLAILDWMMPGMDGVQICAAARASQDEPYIYILLLTAKSQKQDIIQAMKSGADDYLSKPFDVGELEVRLNAGRRVLELQTELLSVRETLRKQATHDPLTGLPNRLLFGDRLTRSLSIADRHQESVAVLFLDLDRFKLVNDTLGHSAGDALLKQVSARLSGTLRQADTVARMGGDEFTIILTGTCSEAQVARVAEKVLQAFSKGFQIGSRELFITPSIGISIYPMDGKDAETLVRNADTAMYRAKERGRNNYHMYTEALNTAAIERVALEADMRKALKRNEFVLHYQPRYSIKTGTTVGAEALIRWHHPNHGIIYPNQFITLAEETGLIVPLGEWVLRSACAQTKAWLDEGLSLTDVAVNVSARQFLTADLHKVVQSALADTGLEPRYLGIELTESTLMQNPDHTADVLRSLKSMGLQLYIDDFGTGYSSLSHLKSFPIDALKIDRSFVKEILTNADDAAISKAVTAMAHGMNLRVVAEGVETLEQLEALIALGCDELQGYFLGRPVPASSFGEMLREETPSSWLRAA